MAVGGGAMVTWRNRSSCVFPSHPPPFRRETQNAKQTQIRRMIDEIRYRAISFAILCTACRAGSVIRARNKSKNNEFICFIDDRTIKRTVTATVIFPFI